MLELILQGSLVPLGMEGFLVRLKFLPNPLLGNRAEALPKILENQLPTTEKLL